MPDRMPEDMSDRMPEDMPDRFARIECQNICQKICQNICQIDMPDRMSEDMSDRMPEDLPVRKCKNVMVGIIRSEVMFMVMLSQVIIYGNNGDFPIPMLSPFFLLESTCVSATCGHQEPRARSLSRELHDPMEIPSLG